MVDIPPIISWLWRMYPTSRRQKFHRVELGFCAKAEAKALAALKSSWPRGVMTTVGVPVQKDVLRPVVCWRWKPKKLSQKNLKITAVSLNGKQTFWGCSNLLKTMWDFRNPSLPSPWISQLNCRVFKCATPALHPSAPSPPFRSNRCHQRLLLRPKSGARRAPNRGVVEEKARHREPVSIAITELIELIRINRDEISNHFNFIQFQWFQCVCQLVLSKQRHFPVGSSMTLLRYEEMVGLVKSLAKRVWCLVTPILWVLLVHTLYPQTHVCYGCRNLISSGLL